MKCEYIGGVSELRCPLYHLKKYGGIEALTEEFKERVCHREGIPFMPMLEEYTASELEICPIFMQLKKEVHFRDMRGKHKNY